MSSPIQGAEWGIGGRWPRRMFDIFLLVSSLVSGLGALTVLWPHSPLSAVWSVKETEYHQLLRVRTVAGGGFAILSVVLASTIVGWLRRRRWAWFLESGILFINLVSGVLRIVMTQQWSGAIGVLVEGLIVVWVTSRPVRLHYGLRTHTTNDARPSGAANGVRLRR